MIERVRFAWWSERGSALGSTLLLAAPLGQQPAPDSAALHELRPLAQTGMELERRIDVEHELALLALGATRDGAFIPDNSGGWCKTQQSVLVRDRFVEVSGASPRALQRTFLEATASGKLDVSRGKQAQASEQNVMDSPFVVKSKTDTLQRSVLFTWIGAENDWAARYQTHDGEESYLEGLRFDMDYTAALPTGPVAVGASWEIESARIRDLLAPGGNLLLTPRGGGIFGRSMEIGLGGDFADYLTTAPVVKEARATFQELREVGGSKLAVVAVRLAFSDLADRSELYFTARTKEEKREPAKLEGCSLAYEVDGNGELLWNLDGGWAQSFTFTGKESFTMQVDKSFSSGGKEPVQMGQRSQFGGAVSFRYEARRPSDDLSVPKDAAAPGGG